MDRLTHTNKGMAWYKSDLLLLDPSEMCFSQISEVLERLAAYEDTGLTPEEIKCITSDTALITNKKLTDAEVEELIQMIKRNPGAIMVCTEDEADVCFCCDEMIPEGSQVCPACEKEAGA